MKIKGIRIDVQTGAEVEVKEEISDEVYQQQLKQFQAQDKLIAFRRLLEYEKRKLLKGQVWNSLLNN